MTANDVKNAMTDVFTRNLRVPFRFHVNPRKFILRIE
jgi:hypothetical protein